VSGKEAIRKIYARTEFFSVSLFATVEIGGVPETASVLGINPLSGQS
jgi:hypothetical protein